MWDDVFIILNFEPTMRSESRVQVYLYYAEPQGGNEDLFLVILNSPSINTNNRTPFRMRLFYENQFQIQSFTPAPYP